MVKIGLYVYRYLQFMSITLKSIVLENRTNKLLQYISGEIEK